MAGSSNWMNRLSVGEVSLPNCEGSRHHYVPQMLLRRGKLYELDKQTGEVKETTVKKAAWDKDLYRIVRRCNSSFTLGLRPASCRGRC